MANPGFEEKSSVDNVIGLVDYSDSLEDESPAMKKQRLSGLNTSSSQDGEMLKRIVEVRSLLPVITDKHMELFFAVWGTVLKCTIIDRTAYIEYSKAEEAKAAVESAEHLRIVGQHLIVKLAESVPPAPAPAPSSSSSSSASSSFDMVTMMTQAVTILEKKTISMRDSMKSMTALQASYSVNVLKLATQLARARTEKMKGKEKMSN